MKNVFKRIPKTFILVILVWVLIIYNILNRWNLISSEGYIIVEFFIYLLSLITLIWGLIWAIKHKSIKTKKFSILIICIALECVYTFSGFADISKLYIDFCSHYTQREQIVEQILGLSVYQHACHQI